MKKEKIPNKVYEQLRTDILLLDIKPGEMLSEIELSNRFNVSRTPVRDALIRLEKEGLIEVRPHIGTFVTLIDLDLIGDLIYIREKLEKAIIKDLIDTPNKFTQLSLKMNIEAQRKIVESDIDIKEKAKIFMEYDNDFHKSLFKLNNKESIWTFLEDIKTHYDRLRMFTDDNSTETLQYLYNEHFQIADSIFNGDLEACYRIYDKHIYHWLHKGTENILKNKQYFKGLEKLINF
ncbi:MAG TPA: GntR family transcriptional regulator [Erysipelotrichaceae bacterium]|jgi:DNA-binding GntR family transcriptional regulator|nr:GntR family transcriptional regulator [Erysipelotrichaceae bacterium]HQA85132.1 GntR family transcriptional regulator [Erysipelotrichaceae bacterium]